MTKRFKIEPDLTCPELAGYKLPEVQQRQEDDVYIDYPERPLGIQGIVDYQLGFQSGYAKALEKFEFTESDLRQAVALSLDDAEKSVIWSKEWYPNKLADKIIASLRTTRHPIAIDVEMEYTCCKRYMNCIGCDATQDMIQPIIPATNPDGTVKGVYVYE